MDFFAKLKKYSKVRISFIIAIIGLFFCVGGGFAMHSVFNTSWVETTAQIVKITSGTDDSVTVTITYTDNEGVSHTIPLGSYDSSMKEGQTINIKYDSNNKEYVSASSTEWIVYVLLGVGAAALVGGTISTIIALKTPSAAYNDFDKVDKSTYTQEQVQELKDSTEEKKEYIYHQAGKAGYSHIMETCDGLLKAFEANCDKVGVLTKSQYTFINHLTLHKVQHKVSHVISKETEDSGFALDMSYSFDVDGVSCWEILGKMGYSLDPELETVTRVCYHVKKYGVEVATITPTGVNDIPNATQYPWGNVPSNTVLKVYCRDSDIDGVGFACFCITKK